MNQQRIAVSDQMRCDMLRRGEPLEELDGRTPLMYNLLAADCNHDWELDHPDVEAVDVDAFDELPHHSRLEYLEPAQILQTALADDDAVKQYLQHVGTGLSPIVDRGMMPKQWSDSLVERLERG